MGAGPEASTKAQDGRSSHGSRQVNQGKDGSITPLATNSLHIGQDKSKTKLSQRSIITGADSGVQQKNSRRREMYASLPEQEKDILLKKKREYMSQSRGEFSKSSNTCM
ncbi:hypothetical protein EJB05_34006 [Eragrostis curvula]|uniref:Uncharacterized protein n=1 Tax=Eragrostis curvula TaxID=38414 RepID=A0A5J9U2X4_9POAL|nr:hypothetical protein EJB05_34006 [Eragrostis curvula]